MGNYRREIGGIETVVGEVKLIPDTAGLLRKLRHSKNVRSPGRIFLAETLRILPAAKIEKFPATVPTLEKILEVTHCQCHCQ